MKQDPGYLWNPDIYHESSSAQEKWAHEIISKISLQEKDRILDLGSGDGKITAYLSGLVPEGEVVGLDSSLEMVNFARDHYPPSIYPNLSFIQGDMQKIKSDKLFDIIFSNAALHWVKDHVSVLKGIQKILKSGGSIMIQCGGEGNAKDFFDIALPLIQKDPWSPYFKNFVTPYYFYSDIMYKKWLIDSGLVPVRVELLPKDMEQTGREGIISWIQSTWLPFTQPLPASLKEKFISALADLYLQNHPPDSRGIVHVQMVRLEVQAIKE